MNAISEVFKEDAPSVEVPAFQTPTIARNACRWRKIGMGALR
jgi:hypothetical protein